MCAWCLRLPFFHSPILKHDGNFLDWGKKSGMTQCLYATHLAANEASFMADQQQSLLANNGTVQIRINFAQTALVTHVHENYTSRRRSYTAKYRDERENKDKSLSVLGNLDLVVAGNPYYDRLCIGFLVTLGKKIQFLLMYFQLMTASSCITSMLLLKKLQLSGNSLLRTVMYNILSKTQKLL